jgi:hypothetical protein
MIDEYVLKAKSWQLFLTLSAPILIFAFIPKFNYIIFQLRDIAIFLTYFSWLMILGRNLNSLIPKRHTLSESFFIFNIFYIVIYVVSIKILLDPGVTIHLTGYWTLIVIYFLFAFLYVHYFAAKALTSAEQKRRTSFNDHFKETIALTFCIVGIWFIQPRINELYKKKKLILDD